MGINKKVGTYPLAPGTYPLLKIKFLCEKKLKPQKKWVRVSAGMRGL